MVINGSIAQIRSIHCIASCRSWFGKAPRRASQIRDNCQAVDGEPWQAAEGCPIRSRLLKAFDTPYPFGGDRSAATVPERPHCCDCYDDAYADADRASTKRRSQ